MKAAEQFEKWLNNPYFNEEIRKELLPNKDDEN